MNFLGHDVLGQAELGNAVNQNATGFVKSFENRNVVAFRNQIAGDGQAGRPGTDHSHTFAGGISHRW